MKWRFNFFVLQFIKVKKEQIRGIIYFHWKKGINYKFCYKEIIDVLGDKTVSEKSIFNWYRDFNRGEDTFKDDHRIGRPKSSTDDFNIKKTKEMIQKTHQ